MLNIEFVRIDSTGTLVASEQFGIDFLPFLQMEVSLIVVALVLRMIILILVFIFEVAFDLTHLGFVDIDVGRLLLIVGGD